MTDDQTRTILYRLEAMENSQRDEHGEVRAQLGRIETQARLTNGRISKLELWQARMDGARWAFSWLPTVITGVITAVVVYLLTNG